MTVQELYKIFKGMTKEERERMDIGIDNRNLIGLYDEKGFKTITRNVGFPDMNSHDTFYLDATFDEKD